ncbi:MAG TPA: SLC13 family permease, partial [Mariprofundaceae bacterium]|nr:SLC13 family permease [Mariprofundaceae bacterium]
AAMFLALAWGAVVGGVATLLGGARGPLALAIVEEMSGKGFSFSDWTAAAWPMVLGMLAIAAFLLLRVAPGDGIDMGGARERIGQRQLELGQLSVSGRLMAVLMLVTVTAWVLLGESAGLAGIALLAVTAMFALRIVSWREIQSHVDWGVVLMYGGAIAVAKALEKTGAAGWLTSQLWPDGISGLALLALLALMTLLLTEAISNSAAVAIMLPMAIPLGSASGLDPVLIALSVGIVSGFAFMLPMGTPANAMVFGTGFVELRLMIRYGSLMMLAALLLYVVTARLWWPLAGTGS